MEHYYLQNGKRVTIDITILQHLAIEQQGIDVDWVNFINEVIYKMENVELGEIDTNGLSLEEYFFYLCLDYLQENGSL